VAIPLLVLAALELGLRVAGYGYSPRFFLPRKIDGQAFLVPNEKFSYRFFPPKLARSPTLFRMPASKPVGTYRIFLLGESAAFGDPDPAYGVGRYLEALLEDRYPATDFEVVCVALTAINSHVILPIARECARYDGDLWVIYMGNNEMIGPYGAGTVFGTKAPDPGRVRATLALKTTRTGQLMDALLRGLQEDPTMPKTWGGIDMFSRNLLPHDHPGRLKTYANFEANLDAILRTGRQAGVPVVVSTVASNLKDCAPFASLHAGELTPAERTAWQETFERGKSLEKAGSHGDALDTYAEALTIDSEFAELHFRMGTCHLALGHIGEARRAFELARDYDALVFRADTRINQALAEGCQRLAGEDLVLVDAAGVLADPPPDAIAGQALFYEHVHYTLDGNYRLARLLAEPAAGLLPPEVAKQDRGEWADAESCNRRLAVTAWDRQRLWREMIQRTSLTPYTSQSSYTGNAQYRQGRLRQVLSQIRPDTPEQDRRLYREAIARAPDDSLLRANHAQFLETTTSRSQAIIEGQQVCRLLPDLAWPHTYVGSLMVREGRHSEARRYFLRALEIRSESPQARNQLRRMQGR
jgi:tetratricopeptide (TPR) repeat protein